MALPYAPQAPAVTAKPSRRRRSGLELAQRRAGLLFVAPYLAFFIILQLGMFAAAIWVSLHHYDLLALDNPFVGLRNYIRLPGNEHFMHALRNTAEYAIVVVILQTIFALLLAVLLDAKIKGRNFFRSTWYTPSIASSGRSGSSGAPWSSSRSPSSRSRCGRWRGRWRGTRVAARSRSPPRRSPSYGTTSTCRSRSSCSRRLPDDS